MILLPAAYRVQADSSAGDGFGVVDLREPDLHVVGLVRILKIGQIPCTGEYPHRRGAIQRQDLGPVTTRSRTVSYCQSPATGLAVWGDNDMKKSSAVLIGVVCLGAGALSSCSIDGSASTSSIAATTATPAGPGTFPGFTPAFSGGLLTYEPVKQSDGGYASGVALFMGTLSFENGCVLVDGAPFIFPAITTSWDGTTLTSSGEKFKVGDQISTGGSELESFTLPADALDHCGDLPPVLVGGVLPKK